MCGIAGFWRVGAPRQESIGEARSMLEVIRHRGPDGISHYVDPDRDLVLGHARLSIVDLTTGDQPLYSHGGDHVLTCNGEFYDYQRARTQLALRGHRFSTKSDNELALKLYAEKGVDFVPRLRGEFAFALWDRREERLMLVRDRMGVRPLFYRITPRGIYFASEIKALFALAETPRRLSRRDLLHQLVQVMVPGRTPFEEIRSLRAGHLLIVTRLGDQIQVEDREYWDLDYPREGEHAFHKKESVLIDEVAEKLTEAVQLRLAADVPVACYLSGGIDSASTLALASSLKQEPVKAFTIAFDHEKLDESPWARQIAEFVGADHEILEAKGDMLYAEPFRRALWHSERTFSTPIGVAKMLLAERVRAAGYKVVINGEGSDEIFGGYFFFRGDMLRHANRGRHDLAGELERYQRMFKGSLLLREPLTHPAWESLCGFTPFWIQIWIHAWNQVKPFLSNEMKEVAEHYDPIEAVALSYDREKIRGRHPLDIAQYTFIKTMLEGQILHWGGDRVDMAYSIEARPPFLDHELVELAATLPPEVRIRDIMEKWVLRQAMRGVIPPFLYEREKYGITAPPPFYDEAKRLSYEKLISHYLDDELVAVVGVADAGRLQEFINGHRNGTDRSKMKIEEFVLNQTIGVHALQRMFVENHNYSAFGQ